MTDQISTERTAQGERQRGDVVLDKYEILTKLGEGGGSKVYLALDPQINKQWAIKILDKAKLHDEPGSDHKSYLHEAELMKQFDFPGLPRVVELKETDKEAFVVMDYIEGISLEDVLDQTGPPDLDLALGWATQICEIFNYLHSLTPQVIYRDLKPSNIIITPEGNARIIDFGAARLWHEAKLHDTINLGTVGYAAPEQYRRDLQTDIRTDVFNFGRTLYAILTGVDIANPKLPQPPYQNAELQKIIDHCIQPDPNERYQDFVEVLFDLKRFQDSLKTPTVKQGNLRKHRRFLSGLFVALIVAGTAYGLHSSTRAALADVISDLSAPVILFVSIILLAEIVFIMLVVTLLLSLHGYGTLVEANSAKEREDSLKQLRRELADQNNARIDANRATRAQVERPKHIVETAPSHEVFAHRKTTILGESSTQPRHPAGLPKEASQDPETPTSPEDTNA